MEIDQVISGMRREEGKSWDSSSGGGDKRQQTIRKQLSKMMSKYFG
jgi:hypothetical protein